MLLSQHTRKRDDGNEYAKSNPNFPWDIDEKRKETEHEEAENAAAGLFARHMLCYSPRFLGTSIIPSVCPIL